MSCRRFARLHGLGHRRHAETADERGDGADRNGAATPLRPREPAPGGGRCGDEDQEDLQPGHGEIGEGRGLGLLEAVDEGDAGRPGEEVADEDQEVHARAQKQHRT